jgi:L-arabinose transport system permease protein
MTILSDKKPDQQPLDSGSGSAKRAAMALWDSAGMFLVLLGLLLVLSLTVDNFASWINAKGLLLSVATVGMVACTMLFCLAAGDFDLSVGSVLAMSGVLCAVVINYTKSIGLGIGAGVLAGGVVGMFNGFVIAQLGINALITTLATMEIVRGLAFIICDGTPVGIRVSAFYALGSGQPLGMGTPIWLMLICFAVFGILLNRTVFGRNTLAIGGNAEAARLAGVAVGRTKIIIFTVQGMIAGFAGVVLASRLTSGQPGNGVGLELQAISACVLGGVSLTGGIGTMLGVVTGVLIMGSVNNAMSLRNIPDFWQHVARGGILLAAVLIDRFKQWQSE